jgi:hypothetical protein
MGAAGLRAARRWDRTRTGGKSVGSSYGQASMTDRMMRAARLDSQVYEEVEHDQSATSQALTVVIIVAVANGIGQALAQTMSRDGGSAVGGFIAGIVAALVGWALWSGIAYLIGTRVFGGTATYGELLRTIGFANAPGVLNILAFVPILGGIVGFVVGLWILAATVVAMRQALDIDTTKAVLTGILGFIAYIILAVVLITPFALLFGGRG